MIRIIAIEAMPAQLACRVLDASESGYYAWRSWPPSERAIRHAWLTDLIREIHVASRATYGARRAHAELTLGRGTAVGHSQVELLGVPTRRRIEGQRAHPAATGCRQQARA